MRPDGAVATEETLAEVGASLMGAYVGTKVLEQVAGKLYELAPEQARRQEDAVRPGEPAQLAAQKLSRLLGLSLNEQQVQTLATTIHLATGLSWGPVYAFLRRFANLDPITAGLATGASMSLILDQGLTPLLGLSAPNRAYPLVTHLRGFVAHLAYGLATAATVELIGWLGRHRAPRAPRRRVPWR
jgi:hypothetical protein